MNLVEKWMKVLTSGRQRLLFAAGSLYWSLILVFLLANSRLIVGTNIAEKKRNTIVLFVLLACICVSAAFWILKFPGKTGKRRESQRMKIRHILILLLNSAYLFVQIELTNNPLFRSMKLQYMVLNISFIFVMLIILLCFLNSWRKTMLIGNLLSFVFSLVFYYVYLFRGEPFQFIDLFSITTAMEVAGGYDFSLTREIVITAVVTLCLIGVYYESADAKAAKQIKSKVWMRILTAAATIGIYIAYLNTGWNGALGILTDLYRPYETYEEYGTTAGFLCVAKYMRLTPPKDYSEGKVKKLAKETKTDQKSQEGKVKPVNIIAIMNESWADYRLLGDFNVNQPYMEFYDSMKENTIKGNTLVCIQGGGTAKTEYEFLTGNSVKRFPGMVPYVSYFTHDQYSLVSTLKSQGYRAEAMHPNKGSNWKRTSAYRMLSFDKFYTIDDFDPSSKRIRQHISDRANYEKIIETVNKKENPDDPYFLFDITMQNHGGYLDTSYHSDVKTQGYTDPAVNQYLSLLKESDDALKYLINYFKDYDEPTMIVMFGDHYPDLPDRFTEWITGKKYDDSSLKEQERYFATPFFIWANYDIPEEEDVFTSTNYLSTRMLSETGLKMTPYNYYLQNLEKSMPALNHLGYMDTYGEFTGWEDAADKYNKLELEYETLQYNELAKDSGRLDEFFRVK